MCCRILFPIQLRGPTDQAGKALAPRNFGLVHIHTRRFFALHLLVGFCRGAQIYPYFFHWRGLAQICVAI